MSPSTALAFGLLLGSVTFQEPPPQTLPVFGASIENVYVDAFVSHRGAPLSGLSAGDFELWDNGVIQRLDLVSSETQPLLAVLAFDISSSLEGQKLDALRAASQALLDTLRPEDEASLFTFADDIRFQAEPTTDKAAIRKALEQLQPGGGTPLMDALFAAITLPKSRGRSLVVLFTDGVDNLSWLDWRQIQKVAERSNAVVHVVSLQPLARPEDEGRNFEGDLRWRIYPAERTPALEFENSWALRQIAEVTGGRYWEAGSLDRLKAPFAAIAEAMGKRYVLRYAPEGVGRPGWHKLELRLRGKKGDVHTRSGYWVAER